MQVVVSLSEATSVPEGSQLRLQGCLCLPTSALGWPLLCPFYLMFRRQLPEQSEGPGSLPGSVHTSSRCQSTKGPMATYSNFLHLQSTAWASD